MILPIHGEGDHLRQQMVEGGCRPAPRPQLWWKRPAPSTTSLRLAVPLPVNGEE